MLKDVLNTIGETIVQDLRENMQRYGRNASGKTSQSIRFETLQTPLVSKVMVFGESQILNLEYGRKPTQNRQGGVFTVQTIADWIIAKGIQSDLPLKSLAFLIWRKINREGYKGTQGVLTDTINPQNVQMWVDLITKEVATETTKNIKNALAN